MLIRHDPVVGPAAGALSPAVDQWTGRALTADQAARVATIEAVKTYRSWPETRAASPNYRASASAVATDPLAGLQWSHPMIRLPAAWDVTTGARAGEPVIVAVVDTGVRLAHPDLAGQLVGGYDFISSAANALDGSGIDADPDDPGDQARPSGSSWHGTHVAGIVAASANNTLGVAGVAPAAKVMPIRVLGKNGGTLFDILQGIRYAAGLSNSSGTVPAQKADVINLSLGGGGFDQNTQDTIAAARAQGVIVVAAAGNNNSTLPSYPAAYDGVIAVGAVGLDGLRASYSNFGTTVDIAAPGGDHADRNLDGQADGILSTVMQESPGGPLAGYRHLPGTSMAAPHVAAVLALMRAVFPALTPAQADSILSGGGMTDDIGDAGQDLIYGQGLLNAQKAVIAARNLATTPAVAPMLFLGATRFDLGVSATGGNLTLQNVGGGTLSITSVTSGASWVTVSPQTIDASGLGTYRVSVNRAALVPGVYSASVTVVSSAGTYGLPVTVAVASGLQAPDAGRLYVLLVDPVTGNVIDQAGVNGSAGTYAYAFSAVAAGRYRIVAGADLDNDNFICGEGEPCGGWPIISEPTLIDLTASRSGLDFVVGLDSSFRRASAGDAPGRPPWPFARQPGEVSRFTAAR